jgi:SAM-dependent methyltransferase
MTLQTDPEIGIHYDSGYFARLYELESGNFWFRARNRLLLWAFERFVELGSQRYLEIGCGTGFVLSAVERRFFDWTLFGSEVLEPGLAFARERIKRAELLCLDARRLPFDGELDVIGAFDVLEHIEEDEAVLKEIHRALRPVGRLFLTVPQHPFLWSAADDAAHHVRRYTASELAAKLERAGFQRVLQTGFVSLLFPMMLVSRLGRGGKTGTYSLEKELKLSPWLNRVFEGLMSVERWLIQRGFRFSFGGSLLVVAIRADKPCREVSD